MSQQHPPLPPVGSTADLLEALSRLDSAVEDIIAHGPDTWSRLEEQDKLRAVAEMERSRKKLTVADAAFLQSHQAALPVGTQRQARAVSRILTMTVRDARSRIAAWSRIAERPDPWSADPAAPHADHMPQVAALVAEGGLDAEGVEKADRQIRALPADVQADVTRAADGPIADLGRKQGPDVLDALRTFLLDLVGVDEPYTEKDHQRMRSFTLGRQGADGMTPVRGTLTPELAASMQRLMADYARTGDLIADTDGADGTDNTTVDDRTPEQRRHDALAAAVHAGYGRGRALTPGRGATTIVAVMPVEQLVNRTGTALTDVGTHVPATTLLNDASTVETYLQILDVEGRTLIFGRSRRLANLDQYLALVGEEGISSAPGSDAAPAHCHVHHIDGWSHGGATDLDNLTLVSPGMHAQVDDSRGQADRWWTVAAPRGTGRRVHWIPPSTVDPKRRPVHNDHPTTRRHPGDVRRRQFRETDTPP
ncbi:DUF222 domain-containing protein [Corynebacterium sp.]|uniref:HNH endonuclease signature motif containing protein n=1 Tax=Corynebacterium sp. TaxID=1720 RepID=UPI003B3A90AD